MAIFFDDFENLVTIPGTLLANGWTTVSGTPVIETTVVAEGTKSLRLENADTVEMLLAPSAGPIEAELRFWYRFSDLGDFPIAHLFQGALENMSLRQLAGGQVAFYNQGGIALGSASSGVLAPDTWYFIEIKMTFDDSIGANAVMLDIDGSNRINLPAGTDTAWFATWFVDGFSLGATGVLGQYTYFDAVEFGDNDVASSTSSSQSTSTSSVTSSSSSTSSSSTSSAHESLTSSSVSSNSSSSSATSSQSESTSSSVSSSSQSSSSSTVWTSEQSDSSASSESSSSSNSSSSSVTSSSPSSMSSSSSSVTSSSSTSSSDLVSNSTSSSMSSASSSVSTSDTSSTSSSSESASSSSSISSSSSVSSSGAFAANLFLCGQTTQFLMEGWRRRDTQYLMTLLDAAETEIIIDETNVVVLKIGKVNHIPKLDINSLAPSSNGSRVSNTNPVVIRLDKDDLKFAAAIYDLEIVILDSRTGEVVTTLETGTFVLHETQRGVLSL